MRFANFYQQDRLQNSPFELIDQHHTYNPTFTSRLLRSEFLKKGVEINTPDLNQGRMIEFDLFFDGQEMPLTNKASYLIASENPLINPLNANPDYFKRFKKVFTWNKNFFTLSNVIPIYVPNKIEMQEFANFKSRPIFACLINANKLFKNPPATDLYQERVNVIRWYEKHYRDLFSLHGLGWNKPSPAFTTLGKVKRRFSRLGCQLFNIKPFPSYKGEIENKNDVYKLSKFAYCYENARDLPNYITEKIFDCFMSGCVPVYWGSNTINEHIPSECYIDRRKFSSTADVHQYLESITECQYELYQKNIYEFLVSPECSKFKTETFVSIIIDNILLDRS
jgi:alpha(1,3/1,4) fucosyltransferase